MQVFIQVNLESSIAFSYKRPLLLWLNNEAPEITGLDIDSFSDEMLVTQACRLVQDAALYAVYFKVAEPNTPLGAAFKLLEEIIREDKSALILLEGTHSRLTAIVQARPYLQLEVVQNPDEIKLQLAEYFNLPPYLG